MFRASCGLELSEMLLAQCSNPRRLKKSWYQVCLRMHPVPTFWWGSLRMESRPCLKFAAALSTKGWPSHPGSSGKWVSVDTLQMNSRVNTVLNNKALCWPGPSKFINLIPNHHTGITKFNAHHRFRVDCVIRWNKTWQRIPVPKSPTLKGVDPHNSYTMHSWIGPQTSTRHHFGINGGARTTSYWPKPANNPWNPL